HKPEVLGAILQMKSLEQLHKELNEERSRHGSVHARVNSAREDHDKAERDLNRAQGELDRDKVDAVLQGREFPGPELKKKLVNLQNLFQHAKSDYEATLVALQEQSGKVRIL